MPSNENQTPLDQETRQRYRDLLVEVYEIRQSLVDKMTDDELRAAVTQKQKDSITNAKNPNSFWIIKSLPTPDLPKPKGKPRGGLIIVLTFAAAAIGLFVALLVVLLT